MNTVVAAVIALITAILPLVKDSQTVDKILAALIELIPVLVKTAQDLVQPVKNIIAALSANPATTEEQMAALAALDAKVDADFEAAATGALAEDEADATNAAVSGTPPTP